MAEPKTLLQMAGASNAPPPLSESTVVVIDAQREYTDGKLPLTNVAAGARRDRQALAARPRAAGAGDPHPASGQAGWRVRAGHAGLRGRLTGDACAGRGCRAQVAAECIRLDRSREPPRRAEEAECVAGRLHDAHVRRGDRAREHRSRLQGDGGRKRDRDARPARPARRRRVERGRSPAQRARGDRGPVCDRVPQRWTRCRTRYSMALRYRR